LLLLGGTCRDEDTGDGIVNEASAIFDEAGVKLSRASSFVGVSDNGRIGDGVRYELPRLGEGRSIVGSGGNSRGDSNSSCIGASCREDAGFTEFHGLSNGGHHFKTGTNERYSDNHSLNLLINL